MPFGTKKKARAFWKARERSPRRKVWQATYRAKHKEAITQGQWRYYLKSQYGITPEDWQRMFDAQGGVCAICHRRQIYQRLAVDHQHARGYDKFSADEKRKYVRGLLCVMCNRGLGKFVDSPLRLRNAAEYLEKPRPL